MKTWKFIGMGLAGLWVLAQLFPPAPPPEPAPWQAAFFKTYPAPPEVRLAFVKNCVSCHGGNPARRWFAALAPFNHFATNTVKQSKAALDFTTFMKLPKEQRMEMMDQCAQLIRETPLQQHVDSYWLNTQEIDKNIAQSILHWISGFSDYEESLEAEAMVEQ